MLQKSFYFKNTTELENAMQEVSLLKEYSSSKSVLAIVLANYMGEIAVSECCVRIMERLPKVKIAGISVITSVKERRGIGLGVSFCFFEDSLVDVVTYRSDEMTDDEIINDFKGRINETPYLKAVMTFPTGTKSNFSRILNEISNEDENVCYFGALSAARYTEELTDDMQFIDMDRFFWEYMKSGETDKLMPFSIGEELINDGMVFVLLSGERLQINARYILGWRPLGKEMKITGEITDDGEKYCVDEIDGEPAVNIYKKYLNVNPDEHFVDNICEFPVVIQRNDTMIARVPIYPGDNGELFFAGDVEKDDELRLSFAHPEELLDITEHVSKEMKKYGPEALFLTICYNRYYFLKECEDVEIDDFSRYFGEMTFFYGGYEILRHNNNGGTLNSALVAFGMKEGEAGSSQDTVEVIDEEQNCKRGTIPTYERFVTFIDAASSELKEALKDAEQASISKSNFLSNMSHEIRTPINAILGMDEMILRECKDENILSYAEDIRSASNNLLGIVNDILDFSKIEAGKMEIVPVEYGIASVINDLINMIRKRAEDKGLKLNINIDPEIPHILYGDEIRVKQVITNILTNAVKYTETGSITLSIKKKECRLEDAKKLPPEVCHSLKGNCRCAMNSLVVLSVSVSDTGIGMKEEDIPKLFGAFERIEEKRNRTIEGTGLGMSITQNLLNMMGSSLDVKSVYGEGSVFSFDIVQRIVNATPLGNFEDALKRSLTARKDYRESFTAPDCHILVVDDTRMNLTVIRNLLKQTELQIDTAVSGMDCLELCKKNKYDIILLDHRMPEMDGMETFTHLRENEGSLNYSTPVIALTANAVSGSRDMYLDAGFNDYITKPVDPSALETMLLQYLPEERVNRRKETIDTPAPAAENDADEREAIPEIIREADIFDVDKGLQNCGDVSAYMEALNIYMESFKDNYAEITDHFEKEEFTDYTTKVHALKSSSRIIGLMELGDLAESLEHAGNDGNVAFIREKTPELLKRYAEAEELIKTALKPAKDAEEETDAALEEISGDKLKEAYSAIKEIGQMFDYDSLSMVMLSLNKYRMPENERDRYELIRKAYRNADWDGLNKVMSGV